MIFSGNETIHVILDSGADSGIRRIWEKMAKDIADTTGARCALSSPGTACAQAILVGTFGKGELSGQLSERIPRLRELAGKWEAYGFFLIERPLPEVKEGLVILGSDKLGTIYGMFHLSELLGVTAWGFWGDVAPPSYESVTLTAAGHTGAHGTENDIKQICGRDLQSSSVHVERQVENAIAKEPSVKYRGFFINDEWPCFGTWTTEHFGGFTAQMYEHVFEYLLRMKGNYLWPAMWSSSFLLDGPGLASMELATEYGIYIGMSHHEPCMRSGEEFSRFKGEDSPYGTDWDYERNKDGLLRFWEDGLARVKGQNIFPTVGMRGERDSKLLEEGSTVEENVRQLKEIIAQQRRLIREHVEAESGPVPQLFAIYKEVEEYFFGGAGSEGLRGFPELDDVTLLFCDDNFGNMRALPHEEHPGGYGMYYHLDYHGAPISYEWVNSTPIPRIWEQMTQAYEYGVRTLWIANVGDLKFQEYPLGYFMELAYNFERLGTGHYPQTLDYTREWIGHLFGYWLPADAVEKIVWIQEESVRLHGLRRAEALNDRVYHPAHYHEGRTMLERAKRLEQENERMRQRLAGTPCADAYFSMIWYPAAGIANLLKMHLYAGFNHLYASQGIALANVYGEKLEECIRKDEEAAEQLAAFRDGKWRGMELAAHIGFVNWNAQDWRYPLRHVLTLPKEPRLSVSRTDDCRIYTNQYFPVPLVIEDFCFAGAREVTLRVANGGQGVLCWKIEDAPSCLEFSSLEGSTELADEVRIRLRSRKKIPVEQTKGTPGEVCAKRERETFCTVSGTEVFHCDDVLGTEATCSICAGEERVPLRFLLRSPACENQLTAQREVYTTNEERTVITRPREDDPAEIPDGVFLLQGGVCAINAVDYNRKTPGHCAGAEASFEELTDYGKFGSGMKVFPVTAAFSGPEDAPGLSYEIWNPKECGAVLTLHTSPANPLVYGGMLRMDVSVNGAPPQTVVIADPSYRSGENDCREWAEAVLAQEHAADVPITLHTGINQITISPREAGLVLERLEICEDGTERKASYFGPPAQHMR